MGILTSRLPQVWIRRLFFVTVVLIAALVAPSAQSAAFLWTGGEDIDFPNGGALCATTNTLYFRVGYARQGIYPCTASGTAKSSLFRGGGVTSAWLTARIHSNGLANYKYAGLGKSGTNSGLFFGMGTTGSRVGLWKLSSGVWTMLTDVSQTIGSVVYKYDMRVVNYGVAGTILLYVSGQNHVNANAPILTYSGDITVAGAANLDSVFLPETTSTYTSEIIVSDSDTRTLSLVTLSPNAAGDTNDWTGAFTDVNTTLQNDGSPITNNTSGNQFQCNLSEMPSTNLAVLNVKVAARGTMSAGGMTSISVGLKTNGSVHEPAAVTHTGVWELNESYFDTNPVTAANWTAAEMGPLQINLKTAP